MADLVFTTNQLKKKIITLFLIYDRKQLKTRIGYYPYYLALEYGAVEESICLDTYIIKNLLFRITCDNSYGFICDVVDYDKNFVCNFAGERKADWKTRHNETAKKSSQLGMKYMKHICRYMKDESAKESHDCIRFMRMRIDYYDCLQELFKSRKIELKERLRRILNMLPSKYIDEFMAEIFHLIDNIKIVKTRLGDVIEGFASINSKSLKSRPMYGDLTICKAWNDKNIVWIQCGDPYRHNSF